MKVEGKHIVEGYEAGFEAGQHYYSDILETNLSDMTEQLADLREQVGNLNTENDDLREQVARLKSVNALLETKLKEYES